MPVYVRLKVFFQWMSMYGPYVRTAYLCVVKLNDYFNIKNQNMPKNIFESGAIS